MSERGTRAASPRSCRAGALLVLLLAGACGGGALKKVPIPPAPNPDAAPEKLGASFFYAPGEFLRWKISWNGIAGVESRMASGQPGEVNGRRALIVYSESYTTGVAEVFREVREELNSVIDTESGLPISSELSARDGKERETLSMKFTPTSHKAVLVEDGDKEAWSVDDLGAVQDQHSALAVLRGWDAAPGPRGTMRVQSGQVIYQVDLVMIGAEKIKTNWGRMPAIRVSGHGSRLLKDGAPPKEPVTRDFVFWRSDDSRRLPLRYQVGTRFGDLSGELVEFTEGADPQAVIDHRPAS